MGSSLYVEVPGEPPFEVRLDKESVSVGRSEDNVLGLRDMNVSRHHFAVERRANGWHLSDRGSRNGTLVNRQVVADKLLIDGDRIEVGGSCLTFRAQASRASISTAEAPKPRASGAAPPPGARPGGLAVTLEDARPLAAHERVLGATRVPEPGSPPASSTPGPSRRTLGMTPSGSPALGSPGMGTPGMGTPVLGSPILGPGPHPPVLGFGTSPGGPGAPQGPAAPPNVPAASPASSAASGASATSPPSASPPATPATVLPASRTPPSRSEMLTPGSSRPRMGKGDLWRKLAEVTAAINQERDLPRLLERIVDAVLSLVPARGAFLVVVQRDGDLKLEVHRNLDVKEIESQSGSFRLSWQVCKEAIEGRKPILTQDAEADSDLANFASVAQLKLKAILCVPFAAAGEVLGVVYIDEPVIEAGVSAMDVVDLVAAFGDLAGIAFANARYLEEVKERERMAEGLRLASKIQRKLLPESAPALEGVEVAGRTIPAEEVGGDLYDFFGDAPGDCYISIGDVSGKGVGAGIVMATVHALLRAHAEREPRTNLILAALNRALARDLERGSFVSMLLLRWSRHHKALAYASAGHEHMIVYRARSNALETVRSGGVVLGLTPNIDGKLEEKRLDLEAGDLVVLYTDGATEAANPTGEEFGLERVESAVREAAGRSAKDVVEHVITRVQEFQGAGRVARDDLTVVAIRKT